MRKFLSAAVATAGLAALVSPTAAAQDLDEAGAVIRLGKSCAGSDVVRCAWVEWDYRYYRARALVTDPSSVGYDQDIAVSRLRFQYDRGGRWVTLKETPDYDGWKDTSDGAIGSWMLCQRRIRAVAYFQWRRHGAVSWTGEWKSSQAVYRSC
jgi:hypothetical protein